MTRASYPQHVFIGIGVLMLIVTVTNMFLNTCGLLVFIKNKEFRSPANMFIMSLCVCDLLMSTVAMMPILACLYQDFELNHTLCVVEGFMVYFLGLTSLYLLTCLSLERYIVISRPILSAKITKRVVLMVIGGCWCLGFIWSALPLLGWNRYQKEGLGVSCSIVWDSNSPGDVSYVMTIFAACFAIPVMIMMFSYFKLYKTVKAVASATTFGKNSRIAQKNMQVQKKMFYTCFFIVFAFIVSWTPYAVVSFISAFHGTGVVSPVAATLPAVIAKTGGLWDPLIYVMSNKQFRTAFRKLLSRTWLCSKCISHQVTRRRTSQTETVKYSQTAISVTTTYDRRSGVSVHPSVRKKEPESAVQALDTIQETAPNISGLTLKTQSLPHMVESQNKTGVPSIDVPSLVVTSPHASTSQENNSQGHVNCSSVLSDVESTGKYCEKGKEDISCKSADPSASDNISTGEELKGNVITEVREVDKSVEEKMNSFVIASEISDVEKTDMVVKLDIEENLVADVREDDKSVEEKVKISVSEMTDAVNIDAEQMQDDGLKIDKSVHIVEKPIDC